MNLTSLKEEQRPGNSGFKKMAIQCLLDSFVFIQTFVLICFWYIKAKATIQLFLKQKKLLKFTLSSFLFYC